jgi:hypothetical protein
MTVYIAHGFNVRDPRVFFKVGQAFAAAGHEVIEIDYGWTGLISARIAVAREGRRLADIAKPGDIAIGHSNGAAVIARALDLGAPLRQVLLVNPALDKRRTLPGVEQADIYYAHDDLAVLAGKWLRWISPLRLIGKATTWGEMGRTGYRGKAQNHFNWSLHSVLETLSRVGHSGAFAWHRVHMLTAHMLQRVAA